MDQDVALERFAELLLQSPHNLVSRGAREELKTRHLPECVAFARMLPDGRARLLDIGSGGGLPGIVIAIVRTDLDVHLMESTGKKAGFLREVVHILDLAATVHHGRAEDLAKGDMAGTFDLVTARAVAPLERLIPLATPYLRTGGLLYAIKGDRWAEELLAAGAVLRRSALQVVATPDEAAVRPDIGDPAPRVVVFRR